MPIWKNCTVTVLYHSDEATEDSPCVVKINGDRILVEYEDDGIVQYEGQSNGEGRYVLNGVGFDGRASLHMFPGSSLLEGSWVEEGYRGMWKIKLA